LSTEINKHNGIMLTDSDEPAFFSRTQQQQLRVLMSKIENNALTLSKES
jgi:hypothetical protein